MTDELLAMLCESYEHILLHGTDDDKVMFFDAQVGRLLEELGA